MRLSFRTGLLLLVSIPLVFTQCSVTRHLKRNEFLLIKNQFRIHSKTIEKDELTGYLQQEPNSKLFGLFRANIALYNLGGRGKAKDTKFRKWLRTKIGSAPVIMDSSMTLISKKQMGIYLANKGYMHASVRDSVIFQRKKARVMYIIVPNTPYTIRSLRYAIADTELAHFVYQDTSKSMIHRGNNYDQYLLDAERSRISTALMDHGYYHFSSAYIRYRIDSSFNSHVMDITIEIRNPVIPSLDYFGTYTESRYIRYSIDKILINPEYDLLSSDTLKYDTLVRSYKASRPDTNMNTYYFLFKNKFRLKPRTLAQMIFLKSGTYFNLSDVNQTYSQLASLQLFKYMNIQFRESSANPARARGKLDCKILLSRVPPQSFSISTDGTNSSGAFGVQGNLVYQNRNLFRGGQIFRINLSGAAQMQGNIGPEKTAALFNTIELGINTNLTFPQFLIPIKPEILPKKFKPKTIISLGYNFQKRPDYIRHISNVTFGYTWYQNDKIRHVLNPAEITLVKMFPDSVFNDYIFYLKDKRLKNQYTNHLVEGLKYTITYSGQDVNVVRDFFYVRSNIETGGNLVYLIDKAISAPIYSTGYFTLFNIQYAQFIRPDLDVRFYHFFTKTQSLVTRFYAGIGYPYGNSISLPFEKAFFAGGANDMRGWKMGTLGPGRYHNDTSGNTYDQTGDFQLQLNMEYRFPVYKYFRSALFIDVGNVWLLHDAPDLPGGKFQLRYLAPDIAIDVGLGIRADFDYFIIRIDPAVPIRVPYYPASNHWYAGKLNLSDIIWNFGIGYPF